MNDLEASNQFEQNPGVMSSIAYRAASESDVEPALGIFFESLRDFAARYNAPVPSLEPAAWAPAYRHVMQTGIFRVAEVEGQLAAICGAIVRDDIWFLSCFWARPQLQHQGIGQPLLRQVMDEGRARGAKVFSVWSTFDTNSMACYMKQGMLPGFPIFVFTGAPVRLPALEPRYELAELRPGTAHMLDLDVRGTRRIQDHLYYSTESGQPVYAREIQFEGKPVGYYYTSGNIVGPAAWTADEHAPAVLSAALADCGGRNESIRIVIPGINHVAVQFALNHGLRLTLAPHFLTSGTFGHLDRYIISGPNLF